MYIPIGLFLFVFSIYLRTHCATFNINDSGETIMVCDLLTISHSPGYPLHTLWGKVHCLLPLGKPMLRVTFSSMMAGALSVVMLYWALKMMFRSIFQSGDAPSAEGQSKVSAWLWEIPALFGALVFAFSYQHWFQACGAKGGIYTLNSLLSTTMFYLFFRMRESGWFVKSFLAMGFLYGLSLAHHWPNQMVMMPAYLWLFLASQKRVPIWDYLRDIFTLKLFDVFEKTGRIISALGNLNIIRAITLGMISLSLYLYLTIRSVQNPLVNWWNPENLDRLWGTVIRKGYQGIGDKRSWETIVRNLKRFWLHAHHQYGDAFTYFIVLLAFVGMVWLWKRQRSSGIGILLLGLGVFLGVILFNNPLEGYQWTLDNFFTPIFMMGAMFAAAGVAWISQWVSTEWRGRWVPYYVGAICLSFALVTLMLNYTTGDKVENGQTVYRGCDQSRYISSYDEGMNMLKTVVKDAVILCNGDIDILPLWYLQYVEKKRPDVTTFTMQLIPYEWYRNPLFERSPSLAVPVGQDVRQETVVQKMINDHAKDRPFYFTNIFTAPWLREKNPALPDGLLWRLINTKGMNFPFTSKRVNDLWSGYRLRNMDAPTRGYWDEYTDVMKDSYGIGYDFTGYFGFMNKMYDLALWGFNRALLYRQLQTHERIYMMTGETYMYLGDPSTAITNYQECLRRSPRNPYAYARIGDAFMMLNDYINAESAYRASLTLNPQQKEAQDGLQRLQKFQQKQSVGEKGTKPK
jgi:hypothetical protein